MNGLRELRRSSSRMGSRWSRRSTRTWCGRDRGPPVRERSFRWAAYGESQPRSRCRARFWARMARSGKSRHATSAMGGAEPPSSGTLPGSHTRLELVAGAWSTQPSPGFDANITAIRVQRRTCRCTADAYSRCSSANRSWWGRRLRGARLRPGRAARLRGSARRHRPAQVGERRSAPPRVARSRAACPSQSDLAKHGYREASETVVAPANAFMEPAPRAARRAPYHR